MQRAVEARGYLWKVTLQSEVLFNPHPQEGRTERERVMDELIILNNLWSEKKREMENCERLINYPLSRLDVDDNTTYKYNFL